MFNDICGRAQCQECSHRESGTALLDLTSDQGDPGTWLYSVINEVIGTLDQNPKVLPGE